LPAATHMGAVELTVADLDRSLDYYQRAVGLGVRGRENGRASLGGDEELLVLVEEPGARPSQAHTGLFHFALLVPERRALAAGLGEASARDGRAAVGGRARRCRRSRGRGGLAARAARARPVGERAPPRGGRVASGGIPPPPRPLRRDRLVQGLRARGGADP